MYAGIAGLLALAAACPMRVELKLCVRREPDFFALNRLEGDRWDVGVVDVFFFQAEDGIRDYKVTGVQTCALPISKQQRVDDVAAAQFGAGRQIGGGGPEFGARLLIGTRPDVDVRVLEELALPTERPDRKSVV